MDMPGYAPIYRGFGHSSQEVPEISEGGYKSAADTAKARRRTVRTPYG